MHTFVKVMSRNDLTKKQTVITPSRKNIIRSLSRRSYKAVASRLSKLPQMKSYLFKGFIQTLRREMKFICSLQHNSISRHEHESVKTFYWKRIWRELENNMPTLLRFIRTLLPRSDRKFVMFLICAILKNRCIQMSLVQHAISLAKLVPLGI